VKEKKLLIEIICSNNHFSQKMLEEREQVHEPSAQDTALDEPAVPTVTLPKLSMSISVLEDETLAASLESITINAGDLPTITIIPCGIEESVAQKRGEESAADELPQDNPLATPLDSVSSMRGVGCEEHGALSPSERCARLAALRSAPQPEQRSKEWYAMRESMLTASDFQKALTSDASRMSFALDKADPRPFFSSSSAACQHGVLFEHVCAQVYERLHSVKVEEFGLLRHPTVDYIGASPDGICDEASPDDYIARAVEFKAPYSRQIKQGDVPTKYLAQIQGQLEVMQLPACDYLECDFAVCDGSDPQALAHKLEAEKAAGKPVWTGGSDRMLCGAIITDAEHPADKPGYTAIAEGLHNLTPLLDASDATAVKLWAMRGMNLVTVHRNQAWFEQTLQPRLRNVWQQVEKLRTSPELVKQERAKKKKRGGQSAVRARKTGYAFRT
jgi:putative phage-type endonuclease